MSNKQEIIILIILFIFLISIILLFLSHNIIILYTILFIYISTIFISYKFFLYPQNFFVRINKDSIEDAIILIKKENRKFMSKSKKEKTLYLLALFLNGKGSFKESNNILTSCCFTRKNNYSKKCFELYIINLILSGEVSSITLEDEHLIGIYKRQLLLAIIMLCKGKTENAKNYFEIYLKSRNHDKKLSFLETLFNDGFFDFINKKLYLYTEINNYLLGQYYYKIGKFNIAKDYFKKIITLKNNTFYYEKSRRLYSKIQ